jgi:hypothetical protein
VEPIEMEQTWLKDFIAKRPATERAFVLALRDEVWKRIHSRFADLADDGRELEGRAFDLLVRWREREGMLQETDSLAKLARRLVDQVGDVERAHRKRERASREVRRVARVNGAGPPDPERSCLVKDLLDRLAVLVDRLPAERQETFRAFVLEEAGLGPSVSKALSISRDAARMRVVRARHDLLEMAVRERILEPEDVTDFVRKEEVAND